MDSNKIAAGYEAVGGTSYQYVQAWSYPMFGGVVPIHTAGDVPMWFYNVSMIRPFVSGYEDVAWKISGEMAGALVSLAHNGTPGWDKWNSETDAVMVFDEVSQVRYHHEDALIELLQSAGGGGFPF